MRYEDMLYSPQKTFGSLAKFLGLRLPKSRLNKAIEFSFFDTSRKQEDEKGLIEQSDKTDRFFRTGTAGQWKDVLNQDQINRIVGSNFEIMEKYDYLPR